MFQHRWIWLLIMCGPMAAGCADPHNTLPIKTFVKSHGDVVRAAAAAQSPRLVILSRGPIDRSHMPLEVLLVNPLSSAIKYTGYSMDSFQSHPPAGEIHPIVQALAQSDDGWKNCQPGYCGVGMATMTMRPREAGRFLWHVPTGKGRMKLQLSVSWTNEQGNEVLQTVTSEEVVPPKD